MAGNERRSSTGLDRRASTRLSMAQEDDDDYALAAMGISDGFRPQAVMTSHNRMSSQTSQHINSGRRTPPPRPSSTTKPKLESFALRHDGAMGPNGRSNSITGAQLDAGPSRSSSVSTDMAYVRAESPYQGPSGPSHPYQMYPQESRQQRTVSVVTTSTVAVPDRPYTGPGGPTHPYGMYPQNIVPEAEAAEVAPVPPVPVGFPGLNNNYQRRLGPDGEEIADIIGPDGHTEQLPPYTQYPDEAFARKTRPTVQVPVVPVIGAASGAGGIGLATRNPEFESQEDLNTPQSRDSRSIMSDNNHQVNMAAISASEKVPLKKWQQVAKRKACGIVPVWALVLAAVVFIFFGMILGTVLAILKPKHSQRHNYPPDGDGDDTYPQSAVMTTTMTTTFDATPIATPPAGLSLLPTGTYALPISIPSTIQNGCILNTAMSAAWTCTIPMTSYTIDIQAIEGSKSTTDNNEVNLSLGNNTFGNWYAYGTQPPVLTQQQVLNLVVDSQEPSRGPAWFFELPYNKVVILPEGALTATSTKRDLEERGGHSASDFMGRKNVAEPGDYPWFCYWNGTLLEAFIYVNLTSSAGRQSASTSSAAAASSTRTYASSAPSGTGQSSGSSTSGNSEQMPWLPAYPRVLKIEERRIPRGDQSISPYCVKHFVDPYGVAKPFVNSTTGKGVTIFLNETEPTSVSQISGKRSYGGSLETRDNDLDIRQSSGSCGCVWLWT